MYVGKATSLRSRVKSYFSFSGHRAPERSIEEVVDKIAHIKTITTPTVLEAIFKEAEIIRTLQPPYNVLLKDDKSWLWVCFTADEYPRVVLVRGKDLVALGEKVGAVYPRRWGPFTSGKLVRAALDILREFLPWSDCLPNKKRPCFNAQIGRCPGVCTRVITPMQYRQQLNKLKLFLDGRRTLLEKQVRREMDSAARTHDFETAATLRNQLFALQHVGDVALVSEMARDTDKRLRSAESGGVSGRIEGYDVSHLAGSGMVASMVVFVNGEPEKNSYRKFAIKNYSRSNDTGALAETLGRRFAHHEWPLPEILFVDGGEAQVAAARAVVRAQKLNIPVVGIAKGPTRKNVRWVYDRKNIALDRVVRLYPHVLVRVRDEAHRFAIGYQRSKRKIK